MQFLEKLWKMWENIEILNLSLQKEEGTIYYLNKLSHHQVFHKTSISNKNKERDAMIKTVYLGLIMLQLSKILMYEF